MALFGGHRDVSLFHTLNKELINDIIQTEIGYYKFVLERTTSNVYGESMGKMYYEPVRMACLIDRSDQAWDADEFGSDIKQSVGFSFLKTELKEINLVPEVGDILIFRNNFYEVDSRIENQLILGRDPDYALSTGTIDFGDSYSIILNAHLSRVEKLNLIPLRGGIYPSTTKITDGIANEVGDTIILNGNISNTDLSISAAGNYEVGSDLTVNTSLTLQDEVRTTVTGNVFANGPLLILAGATLIVEGSIYNASNIYIQDGGKLIHNG